MTAHVLVTKLPEDLVRKVLGFYDWVRAVRLFDHQMYEYTRHGVVSDPREMFLVRVDDQAVVREHVAINPRLVKSVMRVKSTVILKMENQTLTLHEPSDRAAARLLRRFFDHMDGKLVPP